MKYDNYKHIQTQYVKKWFDIAPVPTHVLFVPTHLQLLFNMGETTDTSSFSLYIKRWVLNEETCAYLGVDPIFQGFTCSEYGGLLWHKNFADVFKKCPGWGSLDFKRLVELQKDNPLNFKGLKAIDIKKLQQELLPPVFDSSSDDDGENLNEMKNVYVVNVSQGGIPYSAVQTQTVAVFKDENDAKKLVQRLEQIMYSNHPETKKEDLIEKMQHVHPRAIVCFDTLYNLTYTISKV